MQDKRGAGVPRDQLSEDETMRKSFVGNVYRELDKGSVRVRGEIIGKGDQSVEEVCCECAVILLSSVDTRRLRLLCVGWMNSSPQSGCSSSAGSTNTIPTRPSSRL